MARTHQILVGYYWIGFSSRNASLYRQPPAWAASGSHRTRSKYRAGLAVDMYRVARCGCRVGIAADTAPGYVVLQSFQAKVSDVYDGKYCNRYGRMSVMRTMAVLTNVGQRCVI